MSFALLLKKSNSSLDLLERSVLNCSVQKVQGDTVVIDTGLKSSSLCFQNELNLLSKKKKIDFLEVKKAFPNSTSLFRENPNLSVNELLKANWKDKVRIKLKKINGYSDFLGCNNENVVTEVTLSNKSQSYFSKRRAANDNTSTSISYLDKYCLVGLENGVVYGEPKLIYSKALQKICRRKLVWTELTKVWHSAQNRIKAFILNSVNGGYAVAIAGHIAFLPRSLRLDRKVFHGQWRFVKILNMNQKIGNIVVRELRFDNAIVPSAKQASGEGRGLNELKRYPSKERRFTRKTR